MYKISLIHLLLVIGFLILASGCNGQGRAEYQRIDEKKEVLKTNRSGIVVGASAPTFELPTPDSKMLGTEDFKGKYLLLDFWASWCATCIKHNKRLKSVYKRLKSRGFEILAVSLDRKEEAWKKAITKRGFVWPHVSDLKGIDSEVSTAYGIQYVPNFVLLDPKGKIIRKYHEQNISELEADLERLTSQPKVAVK